MQVAVIFALLIGAAFASTSVILLIGMVPTIVAYFVDSSKEKLKPVTVGAMNLAGCFPFVLEMWMQQGSDVGVALATILDAKTIAAIYSAALIGYMIDWAMTGLVAQVMHHRGRHRLDEIEKRQEQLILRWGPEVRGDVDLDEYGFPVDAEGAKALEEAHGKGRR